MRVIGKAQLIDSIISERLSALDRDLQSCDICTIRHGVRVLCKKHQRDVWEVIRLDRLKAGINDRA